MSETMTVTLSPKRMDYLRKYAGRLGQRPEAIASAHMAQLLDQMKAVEGGFVVTIPKLGTIND